MAWLRDYLSHKLPGVTMLMVSHDQGFLQAVCTGIIHFHDLRLDYYDGGMAEFREKNPTVVLPSRVRKGRTREREREAAQRRSCSAADARPLCGRAL